jgi:hypothetical protein
MLTALIIISLLSLLIATEAEPAAASVEATPEKPLRPTDKPCCRKRRDETDRLAA